MDKQEQETIIKTAIEKAKTKIKVLNKRKKYYAFDNPSVLASLERSNLFKTYSNGNTKSIKKMVAENQIYCCNCNSNDFRDVQQYITCKSCGIIESKQRLIDNHFTTKKATIKTKGFYYAKRIAELFNDLKDKLSEKELKKFFRNYAFMKEERTLLHLNDKTYDSRKEFIGRTGFMMPTTEWHQYRLIDPSIRNISFQKEFGKELNF